MVAEADDAIELHDLQAQIDLSMSFAQSLVTSWVNATHYTRTDRQEALEDEIKESMCRPSRLGVGASVSEEGFVREAARLKYKLGGKNKRLRGEQSVDMKQVQSDNEEESRTGAIKKKARTDPFSTLFKKRKNSRDNGKTQSTMHPTAVEATLQKWSSLEKNGTKVDEVARKPVAIPVTLENNKGIKFESPVHHAEERAVQTETTSQPISESPATSKLSSTFTLSQPFAHDIPLSNPPSAVASPISRWNISSTSDSTLPCEDITTDTFPQQPLLNLRGSPSEPESDPAGHSGLTSKKKRKRRKKKKLQQNAKKNDSVTSVS